MTRNTSKVAQRRGYLVESVRDAKLIAERIIAEYDLSRAISFGLPEVDDRTHVWRVPVKKCKSRQKIGEIVIEARTSLVNVKKSTTKELLEKRLLNRDKIDKNCEYKKKNKEYPISSLRNTIGLGDSEMLLEEMPAESIDLVFTSPPYFNARPEYSEYTDYEEYLNKMRKIIRACGRVLNDGRFFVLNVSPVLIRRASRNESSKRIAVPFDFHRLFIEEGFEFIDDIHWKKPSGAGWATGRGRRFAADRNALQYKAVPVTEYVLVYRKKTTKLIDWYIRNYPDKKIVEESKIRGSYEATNVWDIKPAHSKKHPAIFPEELASQVIKFYSFKNDVVLDPFAGIGTVGIAAIKNKRRFVLLEFEACYVKEIKKSISGLMGKKDDIKNGTYII